MKMGYAQNVLKNQINNFNMAKVSKGKNISAGVAHKKVKAPMVDPKGAWTKIQERTIGAKGKKSAKKK
jgi:hypothetical protein